MICSNIILPSNNVAAPPIRIYCQLLYTLSLSEFIELILEYNDAVDINPKLAKSENKYIFHSDKPKLSKRVPVPRQVREVNNAFLFPICLDK